MLNSKKHLWMLVGFFLACAILVVHSWHYMPFLSDDALISLRYVNRLLHGHGLTWTDGRPVEGYSNLLWILSVAGISALGVEPILAARILGLTAMCAVIFAVAITYICSNRLNHANLSLPAGILFFCLAAPIAVWAIGGLEQPLLAALLSVSIGACFAVVESDDAKTKATLLASFMLGLLCITRPDGPIFTVAAVSTIALVRPLTAKRQTARTLFLMVLFPILFYGGQIVFRICYYGEFVPNTALVKLTPSRHFFTEGLRYVASGMLGLAPFSLVAVLSLNVFALTGQARKRAFLLLNMTLFWLLYVIVIGGDIFPARRHFVPIIVIFTFAIVEGIDRGYGRIQARGPRGLAAFVLALGALYVIFVTIQFTKADNKRAISERWEWDGQVVGLLLKRAFSDQQPLIAVTAAGCLPYWSELPALDMLGLNDYYLPRHPPQDVGEGLLGHELGNGRYVLDQKPDIIIFHTGIAADPFRSGQEMQRTDEFFAAYTPVQCRGTTPAEYQAVLWFRKYGEKSGIRQTAGEIDVPGYLLNTNPITVAHLNAAGKLVAPVVFQQPVSTDIQMPDADDWDLEVKSSDRERIRGHLKREGSTLQIILDTDSLKPIEIEELVLKKSKSSS